MPSTLALRTRDGVRLIADHHSAADHRAGLVVAHGFTGHAANADVERIVTGFAAEGFGVLVPDLRGHGRSEGYSTAGRDEVADVAAAVAWLRDAGYERVAVVGFSMGGTAVLRHAGLGGDADAVVSVSAPGTWFERGTRAMRIVHWLFERRTGRTTARLLRGVRISPDGWDELPAAPADVAGAIAPRPLLLVHGDADHYFPMHHLDSLVTAAPTATVWVEPGMGHAELATGTELVGRIASWLRSALDSSALDSSAPNSRADVHSDSRHEIVPPSVAPSGGPSGEPLVGPSSELVVRPSSEPRICDDGTRD